MISLPPFPLTGRTAELELLRGVLERGAAGRGGMVILAGEAGTGKTRLAQAASDEARRRGFAVASGRAYPVEGGIPYALFGDALLPLLRELPPAQLSVLARGGEDELAHVFPGLGGGSTPRRSSEDAAQVRTRVLWTVAQLVTSMAARTPLLLALDDVHAADAASLELLHFLARQTTDTRVVLLCTYNESERRASPALRALEQSLLSLGVAAVQRVRPLTRAGTQELIERAFGVTAAAVAEFASLLYGWTRGNVFFIQEVLRALVEEERLVERDGRWSGWEVDRIVLPGTIRDAVRVRVDRLEAGARGVANVMAALGTRAEHGLLRQVSGQDEATLLASLDELRRADMIAEVAVDGAVAYDFVHPMLGQALYAELGLARSRLLHAAIASALERQYGARAAAHADELAYHFGHSEPGTGAGRAVHYLVAAGQAALERFADRAAVEYLEQALERLGAGPAAGEPAAVGPANDAGPPDPAAAAPDGSAVPGLRRAVLALLARARQRLGEYDAAIALWEELLRTAAPGTPDAELAMLHRGLGLAWYWRGGHERALAEFQTGLERAQRGGDAVLEARLRLAIASCLQELGHASEAAEAAGTALVAARALDDARLLARAHRALLMLYTWTGPPARAREHGAEAIRLATATGEGDVLFSSHWALGLLEGLTGRSAAMAQHIASADAVAAELRSPLFSLATAELSIELCWSTGQWERGIAVGERAISLARAFNQLGALARLLVWTAMIHFGRGDTARGQAFVDEAWRLAGADGARPGEPVDVHVVVPAHIGRAAYHLHLGEFGEAIRVGEAGLAIVDRTGYVFWTLHRLLPIVTEAHCHVRNVAGALRCEARLRRDSQRLDHTLGIAWADTCRAIAEWMGGDLQRACGLLREAAESLESVPIVPEAARLRRQLAGRYADLGLRDQALAELRYVHDVFQQIGAEPELSKTRAQFRELGVKPPPRSVAEGAEGLTGRELEIARLVAARQSNKAIGRILDISPRTVSTHLTNIFRKLAVGSRAELADYVRSGTLSEA